MGAVLARPFFVPISLDKEHERLTITVLFPGQGSQYVGMGRDVYEQEAAARELYALADELLGFALSALIFDGPEQQLTDTVNQQPALFVSALANWYSLQKSQEVQPAFLAGHSLGELTALTAAGSLAFADGLRLVRRRGELMQAAGERHPGAMAALLALDADRVATLCQTAENETGQIVRIANDNCPGQIVVSGHEAALQRAMALAEEAGARRVVRLPITIAAHSPLMAEAAEAFATAVAAAPIQPPQIPVIGNVGATPLGDVAAIRRELAEQLTSPVAWTNSMRYAIAQGSDTFIEVGPGNVLLGLLKRIDRGPERIAFDKGAAAR